MFLPSIRSIAAQWILNRVERYSRRPASIGVLVALQSQIAAGLATNEEREWARRSLKQYRTRYWQGNLSPLTARRLGLIDAEGNELACKIGKG